MVTKSYSMEFKFKFDIAKIQLLKSIFSFNVYCIESRVKFEIHCITDNQIFNTVRHAKFGIILSF